MQLFKNVILITGGTSGIGFELVKQLYNFENRLIVTSSNQENLDNLKILFPNIITIVCDLSDNISVRNLISKCLMYYKDINIIINNAGIQNNYSWTDEKEGYFKIENEISINFTSPSLIIYGLLPLLLSNQNSAVVNVSSALAFAPKKSAPIYCGTKAAIHIMTKALRYQLEMSSVKVFEIIPSLVDTPMANGRPGEKVSPTQVVKDFLINFKNNKFEINVGKTRFLRLIQRISPKFADNLLKNG